MIPADSLQNVLTNHGEVAIVRRILRGHDEPVQIAVHLERRNQISVLFQRCSIVGQLIHVLAQVHIHIFRYIVNQFGVGVANDIGQIVGTQLNLQLGVEVGGRISMDFQLDTKTLFQFFDYGLFQRISKGRMFATLNGEGDGFFGACRNAHQRHYHDDAQEKGNEFFHGKTSFYS